MAEEEQKPTEVPAPAPEASEAEANGEEVELTEPRKLPRPDRTAVQEAEASIRADIKQLDAQMDALAKQAKQAQTAASGQNDGMTGIRAEMKRLKGQKSTLLTRRNELYAAQDQAKEARDKTMGELAKLKTTKHKTVEDIDKAIAKLELQQSTTSMPLNKEKELLKEIEDLRKARKLIGSAAPATEGGAAAPSGNLKQQIGEINKELTAVKKEMEKYQGELDKLFEMRKDTPVPGLLKQREALRDDKKKKQDEIEALWDEFKTKNAEFKKNQEEWQVYKAARDKARKKENERFKEERRKQREEELAKKTPYEEEMNLCDYLSNYLTTTFLGSSAADGAAAAEEKAEVDFEGGSELSSKKNSKDEMFMALGGRKKKGKKSKASGPAGARKGKIVLFPETIEAFSLLKMEPPATVAQVPAAVEALKAKKEYFSTLPRGEIESIAEMNQKFEIQEENRRPARDGGSKPAKKSNPNKGARSALDAQDLEAFPTLGGPAKPAAEAEA
mmetsp:Transcript_23866/g.69928  ORF Transcript_23866/g.69928 Transcript_23866/m.69928 type:complete len:502 (-) Transcript_23866:631-2136(-)|eukprot:CAMPEP_0118973506 /NCGR_PEP_ID=MMETSP1173-20130426/10315_1 /TAXON_ID=1034831 /ORGANISM="Rhizochromulina marina cf, Strain CCMP1243" /LENGTH=501 /DNA_ID=CAMNT_0006923179 /DNA_START=82 /DNA_END=1587 /DNA_ORIENTATION=+